MQTPVIAVIPALSFFLALSSAAAQEGIYKWTDAQGTVHFSNTPTGSVAPADNDLPPASNFGASPEPAPPAPESIEPSPTTAAESAADDEPSAAAPTADDEPAMAGSEPAVAEEQGAMPVPEVSADQPALAEPTNPAPDDLGADESIDTGETGEGTAE